MVEERKLVLARSRWWMKRPARRLLSGHVVKPRYATRKISEAMTPRDQVHTINKKELGKDPIKRADKFFLTSGPASTNYSWWTTPIICTACSR